MDFKYTNQAVIKSMFLQMDKTTFIKNALDLKKELKKEELKKENQNYIFALITLMDWCRVVYIKRKK